MGTDPNEDGTKEGTDRQRRRVLQALGGLLLAGPAATGHAAARGGPNGRGGPPDDVDTGPPDHAGGGPPDEGGQGPADTDGGERTIEWEGQGSEHATQDCSGAVGYWHWILTPGGATAYDSVGELSVTFEDGTTQTVQGAQRGNGAYHFDVRKPGGGTVTAASIPVIGGGQNALLTISDGDCEAGDTRYWQVDFGAGEVKDPPAYWPDDVMAALGNSDAGVTENPSLRRQRTEGQLADVDIVDNEFTFDETGNPTEVTVEFSVADGGETRQLHLSSWILPGEFEEAEIDQQERYDSTVATFDGGESGTLTIDVP